MPAAYYDGAPVDRIRAMDGASSLRGRRKVMPLLNASQQEFIEFVLSRYIQDGVAELDTDKLPALLELKYRAVADAVAPSVWKLKLSKAGMWISADVRKRILALASSFFSSARDSPARRNHFLWQDSRLPIRQKQGNMVGKEKGS